ncbi:SCP-like protein, partial [Cooperia oncophora]
LQLWSCDAESYAQSHADSCNQALQPVDVHPGHKENVYRFNGTGDPAGAAEAAMNNWWSQLARNGVPSNMQYTQQVANQTAPVTSFTKMAWWNNIKMGCAINQCNGFMLVVCMYSPGGNDIGRPIYNIGAPCSQCQGGCIADLCT